MNSLLSKIESDLSCNQITLHARQYLKLLEFESNILKHKSGTPVNLINGRNPLIISFKGHNNTTKKQLACLIATNLKKEIYSINHTALPNNKRQQWEAEKLLTQAAIHGHILYLQNAEAIFKTRVAGIKSPGHLSALWLLKTIHKYSIPLIIEFAATALPRSISDKHSSCINFDE